MFRALSDLFFPGINEWNAFNHVPINWIAKIVVDSNDWENNYTNIKQFQEKYCIPNERIYLMPIGTHTEDIQKQCQFLIDKCFHETHLNFELKSFYEPHPQR